ncbi:MAG: hypothetical protein M1816_001505 [Peltula sp. TS41687]|nr:MAG: hypothetical protein M1816_001505 [Peltula sp. TS41687]
MSEAQSSEPLTGDAQWYFTLDELSRTPSALDGMPSDKERENRAKGINFITQVGIMLKLPQLTLSIAGIYLQRFFMRYSMVDREDRKGFHHYAVGATALFLATKVEENCRKMREFVIACCRVAQKNPLLVVDEQSKEYWNWRDTILHNEDILLEALCFDLTYAPPYKVLFDSLNKLDVQDNQELRETCWTFINDTNLTMLSLLYPSLTIAASAIYCSARHHEIVIADHEGEAWWDFLGVALLDIRRACNYMASIYMHNQTKPSDKMYTLTPEDGDPLLAKTRERRPLPSQSPTPNSRPDREDQASNETPSSRSAAPSNSDQARPSGKRPRDENAREEDVRSSKDGDIGNSSDEVDGKENTSESGEATEETARKRRKVEVLANGTSSKETVESAGQSPENGVSTLKIRGDPGASEEGELDS